MKVLALRNFRLKHKISLREIAEQMGVSPQWLGQIELGNVPVHDGTKAQIIAAFRGALEKRRWSLIEMRADFEAAKDRFFKEEFEWIGP